MLDRIRLQNFKTHRDTEIRLGRLTVLVGPNGAGKSSVLQAIEMAQGMMADGPVALSAAHAVGQDGEKVGLCAVSLAGVFADGQSWSYPDKAPRPAPRQKIADELEAILLVPNPSRLATPVPVSEVVPVLASDGAGLADVMAKMQLEDNESFQALQTALRAIVPQIQRIGVRRISWSDHRETLAHELVFDVSGRKKIPASMMSGGTLLALGILALLHSPARPRILLLDDIDHGLHPKAQWDLLGQLRALLERYPDLQIVATSHSPDLVDELKPEEVVVMALREDGTSAARPLTECPREDMLGVLKAGQLWSAIGEDWVKE